ncbi:MAG: SPASM domain-containing protein [Candidatus Pacearchaeota archaeon]
MTPCSLLNIPMMNVFDLTIEEMIEKYKSNKFVREMLKMNLKGKCRYCDKKYACGGCRARALAIKNDVFEEDPPCWK